jgi:DNA-binding LacI/PurR family transcriptional regulator
MQDFLPLLTARGRRLVIHCDAQTPYVPRRDQLGDNRRYAFCTRRDFRDLHLAVKVLHDLGHRRIAMPVPPPGIGGRYEWASERLRRVRRIAARFFPEVRIDGVVQQDDFWYRETWVTEEDAFDTFIRGGAENRLGDAGRRPPYTASLMREGLRLVSPSLAAIVDEPEITAVIAPNNTLARLYRCWFSAMGVPIPRRLSVLAFDNTGRSLCVPISTIDQGFEELGFRAAHFLINDISVGEKKSGAIYCAPVVRDRGSLAAR